MTLNKAAHDVQCLALLLCRGDRRLCSGGRCQSDDAELKRCCRCYATGSSSSSSSDVSGAASPVTSLERYLAVPAGRL